MNKMDIPKAWEYMTREERGAILLAQHEGRQIEVFCSDGEWMATSPLFLFQPGNCYRVKHKPIVEVIEAFGVNSKLYGFTFAGAQLIGHTHKITFNTIDGEPDCASIKMERIKEKD